MLSEDGVKIAKSIRDKDLFLSHSLSDTSSVRDAVGLLQQHGANVYCDINDAFLAAALFLDVASRLRRAIQTCRRLVVLMTENTHTSRWIPWEVGLADAFATSARVALLPLCSSNSSSELWATQEYFEL